MGERAGLPHILQFDFKSRSFPIPRPWATPIVRNRIASVEEQAAQVAHQISRYAGKQAAVFVDAAHVHRDELTQDGGTECVACRQRRTPFTS